MNATAAAGAGAPQPQPTAETWGLFFLMASMTFCIVACLVSWVICANLRSPTGDVLRDALLAVLRPQERARRRAVLAEVELAESPESFENSEDEAVLQRRTPPPPPLPEAAAPEAAAAAAAAVAVAPAPPAPPMSAKALGKRRAAVGAAAEESVFLGPTVYGC